MFISDSDPTKYNATKSNIVIYINYLKSKFDARSVARFISCRTSLVSLQFCSSTFTVLFYLWGKDCIYVAPDDNGYD